MNHKIQKNILVVIIKGFIELKNIINEKINLGRRYRLFDAHFVGIGGIGMSGLAQIMNNMGRF